MTHYHPCDMDVCSDIADIHVHTDFRWRNTRTGEVQSVLHPRHRRTEWVQEKRRTFRRSTEWEVIDVD